eukprot:TRINITY_DN8891_c2_g1_i2.p2 TRINITY_DN8891_c2_g1~~TRINITY_DN8891_c2_g1_i2.p2  ORF type:complete len:102 (-),score=0.49 TRINITY_DN8891_c2_g1_i2:82-387(-)
MLRWSCFGSNFYTCKLIVPLHHYDEVNIPEFIQIFMHAYQLDDTINDAKNLLQNKLVCSIIFFQGWIQTILRGGDKLFYSFFTDSSTQSTCIKQSQSTCIG